jgi:DNA-binding response OmpR family regulator
MRVLFVEDDQHLRDTVKQVLSDEGLDVHTVPDAVNLGEELSTQNPDLVLLDHMLPRKTGYQCVEEIRNNEKYRNLPIIMVTGVGDKELVVRALDAGADDYVTKPFVARELLARIRAVYRRHAGKEAARDVIQYNGISLDSRAHRVQAQGRDVVLTLTEYRILRELMTQREKAMSREELRQTALGNLNVTDRTIDVHVAALRRKLGPEGEHIQTVRGIGYRLS